jgi:acetyl-CoA C-acetyltransferase
MSDDIYIVGWAHSPFGKLDAADLEDLTGLVARPALESAGIAPEDVDGIFFGLFNSGFSRQDFPSSLPMESVPELRYTPAVRCENACASGSAAVYAAIDFIRAGRGRIALVVGAEKMTGLPGHQVGDNLLGASHRRSESDIVGGFAGMFGRIAQSYFDLYGDQSDALAMIAAKNHRNGVDNIYAQMRRDVGYDFCREVSDKNPMVAPPLKRMDCSPVSDGAAAIVIADADTARALARRVRFRATAQVNDLLPLMHRDPTTLGGAARAWSQALRSADLRVEDLSFAEVHDCFTIAELMTYEAMGLAPLGQGARVIRNGLVAADGALPINRSGGLKSKGHPIGATGVSMHALAAMQLAGEGGDLQLPGASLGGVFNMGGSGVANYVSILEAA